MQPRPGRDGAKHRHCALYFRQAAEFQRDFPGVCVGRKMQSDETAQVWQCIACVLKRALSLGRLFFGGLETGLGASKTVTLQNLIQHGQVDIGRAGNFRRTVR